MIRAVILVAALAVVAAAPAPSIAHTLPGPTARITVRDGHLTVRVEVEIERLVEPARVPERVRLRIDGASQQLVPDRTPDDTARPHRGFAVVHLEAPTPVPAGASIALELPPEWGPAVVALVEPRTRWVAPGSAAAFALRPPSDPDTRWALIIGGVIGSIALGILLVGWRRARGASARPR